MRTLAESIADLKEEMNMPDTSFCGPALSDHDWTVHGKRNSVGVGCDVELMKKIFESDPNPNAVWAECNWCGCNYYGGDKVVGYAD